MPTTDVTENVNETAPTTADPAARGSRSSLVIVESPAKAKTIAGLLGADYVVESSVGHIRDLPAPCGRGAGRLQGRGLGSARRRRRQRVQAALRGGPGEEVTGRQVEAAGEAGERGLPRHRRGPRGRVDRLAPARGARAPGAGQADGLPRDHHRPSSAPWRSGATSTAGWSTPRRRGGSSTGSTATRSRRCSGRRSCRASRPDGSRAWRPG